MEQLLEKVLESRDLNTARAAAGAVRNRYLASPQDTLPALANWTEHADEFVRITAGLALGTVTVRNSTALPEVMPYVERLANDQSAQVRRLGAAGALELIWLYHYDELWLVIEDWIERKNDLVRRVAIDTMGAIVRGQNINKPSMLKNFIERGMSIMDRLILTDHPELRETIASTVNEFALKAPDLISPWVKQWAGRFDLNATTLVRDILDLPAGRHLKGIDKESILSRVEGLEAELVKRIAGWLRTGKGRMQYFTVVVDRLMEPAGSEDAPYHFWADPFRGCQFRCEFCATRSLSEYAGQTEEEFIRRLVVVANAAEVLARELRDARDGNGTTIVKIGELCDPYQPAEEKFQTTREMLKVFVEAESPVIIQTRSELVLRDLDILSLLAEKGLVNILMTLPTPIEGVRKKLEIGVASVNARLRTIGMLANKGIPVGLVVSPIVPHLTDHPEALEEVVRRGAEAGAAFVLPEVLRMCGTAAPRMRDLIETQIPALVPRYELLYPEEDEVGTADADYIRQICEETVPTLARKYGAHRRGMMLDRSPSAVE
jgi:DNA repair photolyase